MEKLYQIKNWLYKKYWKEKLNPSEICKICDVSRSTIFRWLQKFDISRERSYIIPRHCNLDDQILEWIDGELLGDGCLQLISPHLGKFAYTSRYLEYCEYISDTLDSFGIYQAGKIAKNRNTSHFNKNTLNRYYYRYQSLGYPELLDLYRKWYPKGIKIIPEDMKLTPLVCRQWYLGDGSLDFGNSRHAHIKLATYNFHQNDIERLVEQFKNLGFETKRYSSSNCISISSNSTKDFFNYVGKCPIQCYQYKWDYIRK